MRYGSKSATRWRSAVKAVYLALAVRPDGTRDILGIWIEQTEGAKFWLKVFTDLKTRGCQDVLIAVTDGLKGMSEALAAVYPATTLQTCIVHLIRNSLDSPIGRSESRWPWRCDRSTPPPARRRLRRRLRRLNADRGGRSFRRSAPPGGAPGRTSFRSSLPPDVRRVIYTTNALESVHAQLRKIINTRGHFPNDEAATKLIWLALRNITAKWERGPIYWKTAMNQFAILYPDRFTTPNG
jgi:putative transposase